MIFLIPPRTLALGATQWMEPARADAFEVPVFALLNHVTCPDLRAHGRGVPPQVLQARCNSVTSAKVNCEAGLADALDKPIVVAVPEGEASRPRIGRPRIGRPRIGHPGIGAANLRIVELARDAGQRVG